VNTVVVGEGGNGDGVTMTGINVDVGTDEGIAIVETGISVGKAAGWLPQDTKNTNKTIHGKLCEVDFIKMYDPFYANTDSRIVQ